MLKMSDRYIVRTAVAACVVALCGCLPAAAQKVAVKTNALYWATASLNAAVETRLSDKWTLDMSLGYNPFTFSNNKKLKHIAVQPEARYWLCSTFAGHFVAGHVVYSHFNAGGVKFPFGIFPDLADYRYQGNLGAIGVGYGYSWMLPSKRWSIEAEAGVGYGFVSYTQYECRTCGSRIGKEKRGFVMPTKLAVSIIYNIK